MNIAMQIAASLAILVRTIYAFFSSEKLKEILALKNVGWEDAGNYDY